VTSRFGPDPHAFFAEVYRDTAPWDIGDAQPAMVRLLEELPPEEPVLDVGCGPGDLAIALAGMGYRVLGIDFVGGAIAEARRRAALVSPEVAQRLEFQVADALRPSRLGRTFGAVVDSGFLHLFDPEDRDRFVNDLARCLAPGGRYYVLAFAVTFPAPSSPREVTEAEIRERFSGDRGWNVRLCRPETFESRVAPVRATAACIERRAQG
jgi:ubiquinone/menaquinone biosynthesis C-methylase UbiE